MERHPAVSMPTYDSATSQLNDWLGGARYRGAQEQPGLGFSGLAGLPPHANGGLLGQGYLDAMLPGQGMGGPLQHTPYTPLDASLTERQLADLYPGQLDLLSVPGLAHLDPFLGNYQEEPLFGSTSEGLQDGEDKPRSKMQEKNRRVSPVPLWIPHRAPDGAQGLAQPHITQTPREIPREHCIAGGVIEEVEPLTQGG